MPFLNKHTEMKRGTREGTESMTGTRKPATRATRNQNIEPRAKAHANTSSSTHAGRHLVAPPAPRHRVVLKVVSHLVVVEEHHHALKGFDKTRKQETGMLPRWKQKKGALCNRRVESSRCSVVDRTPPPLRAAKTSNHTLTQQQLATHGRQNTEHPRLHGIRSVHHQHALNKNSAVFLFPRTGPNRTRVP